MQNKVKQIIQLQQTECGLCCAAMIMDYYNFPIEIYGLREKYEVGRNGLSLSNLKHIFSENNFFPKIYKAELSAIKYLHLPFIASWDNRHFVVVTDIKKDKIKLIDPAAGKKSMRVNDFSRHFSNFVLDIEPKKLKKEKVKKKKNPWILLLRNLKENKKNIFILTILTIMVMLLCARHGR